MILHVVQLDDWLAVPDRPYAPASLIDDGFVYCSPDEASALAVASAFYREVPGPLMVLLIDETQLDSTVRWDRANPALPGVAPSTLFPRVYGPISRDAVEGIMEVQRDDGGRATALATWS